METYFDSHIDLLQRRLQKHSDRLKSKAEETFKIRDLSGDLLSENFDREYKNFKLKVCTICIPRRVFLSIPSLRSLLAWQIWRLHGILLRSFGHGKKYRFSLVSCLCLYLHSYSESHPSSLDTYCLFSQVHWPILQMGACSLYPSRTIPPSFESV